MAVVRKSQPSAPVAESPAPAVASMNPDDFVSGGLMDDFDGRIDKIRLCPWDYNGNLDHHVLGAAVTITPIEEGGKEGEAFVQTYSAGDLEHFVPSMDGKTGVDLENGEGEALEGIYALAVGKRSALSSSSNWAQFIRAAIDAGFDKTKITAACTFLEGVVAHFNRVPQQKRSGIVVQTDDKKKRNNDVLVITEIKKAETKAAQKEAAKAEAPTAQAPAQAAPAVGGDLADRVAAEVAKLASAAGESGVVKTKLTAAMLKAFTGADKAKAVKMVGDNEFLSNRDEFAFDPDSGTVYGV